MNILNNTDGIMSSQKGPELRSIAPGNTVRLRGLEFFAYHGVMPEERKLGQKFIVDVDLILSQSGLFVRDDLALTVDYTCVCAKISEVMTRTSQTIEYVAEQIAQELLTDFACSSVRVEVHKPGAPMQMVFSDVSVVIVRANVWQAYLSLGSNMGDREGHLRDALGLLGCIGSLGKISHVYETEPLGGVEQKWFYNMAVELETSLTPAELLEKCHQIEALCGRRGQHNQHSQRGQSTLRLPSEDMPSMNDAMLMMDNGMLPANTSTMTRWGPRTLDIDILMLFRGPGRKGERIQTENLSVPHPRLEQREFVLAPLREIAPDLILPSGREARESVGEGRVTCLKKPFISVDGF